MKLALCTMALVALAGSASADTMANWTFDTASISATGQNFGPIVADAGVNQAGSQSSGHHASASTAWSSPVGNGSPHSFSSNNWAVGDYYQFTTSTAGYGTLNLSFDQISSTTGPSGFKVSYSTDGSSFTDLGTYTVIGNTGSTIWSSATPISASSYAFALPVALENQATIYLRLVDTNTTATNGGTVAATGTDRVDNFVVTGTAVPTPGAAGLVGVAGLVGIRRRRA